MNFDWSGLLWLLLPLAFFSGWYAARRDSRGSPVSRERRFSSEYFRGINFLLNEQPDKAIEVFTQMAEVNSETVETHLALGSLFRRRGEVERAIRIHQNLITRPTLDTAQRGQALCELALDFQKAGLLDRAENLFLELTEIPEHAEQALRSLMYIYEQERDWDKALATGRRLVARFGRKLGPVLAQHCCEAAESLIRDDRPEAARAMLEEAQALDPQCARVSMILGRMAAAAGQYREAIAAWQRIADQDPELLDEVIDALASAYRAMQDEDGLRARLEAWSALHGSPRLVQTLIALIDAREGSQAARAFIAGQVQRHPSLHGLGQLLRLQARDQAVATDKELALIQDILARLAGRESGYLCRQCGFRGQSLHWQCPACHEWQTLRPVTSSIENDAVTPPATPFRASPAGKTVNQR